MKKEGNINFYNVFIEFYKFSVTGSPDVNPATIYGVPAISGRFNTDSQEFEYLVIRLITRI